MLKVWKHVIHFSKVCISGIMFAFFRLLLRQIYEMINIFNYLLLFCFFACVAHAAKLKVGNEPTESAMIPNVDYYNISSGGFDLDKQLLFVKGGRNGKGNLSWVRNDLSKRHLIRSYFFLQKNPFQRSLQQDNGTAYAGWLKRRHCFQLSPKDYVEVVDLTYEAFIGRLVSLSTKGARCQLMMRYVCAKTQIVAELASALARSDAVASRRFLAAFIKDVKMYAAYCVNRSATG